LTLASLTGSALSKDTTPSYDFTRHACVMSACLLFVEHCCHPNPTYCHPELDVVTGGQRSFFFFGLIKVREEHNGIHLNFHLNSY
jgi:hypothetical protein